MRIVENVKKIKRYEEEGKGQRERKRKRKEKGRGKGEGKGWNKKIEAVRPQFY